MLRRATGVGAPRRICTRRAHVSARAAHETSFALEPGVDAEALLEGLAGLLPVRRRPAEDGPAVLLDTPDGRLAAAHALLLAAGEGRATLRLLRAELPELAAELAVRPAFASELPEGPLREVLLSLAGPRRLLPVLEVTGRTSGLDVLDGEGKTVVRL